MRRGKSEPPKWKTVIHWPVFLAANIAILLLIGVSTVRETYKGWTVDREIHALDQQATALEGRKSKLMELTQSLTATDTLDVEARERLGWKKPDERVIVLSGWEAPTSAPKDITAFADIPSERLTTPNPELWWDYFFSASQPETTSSL